MSAWGTAAGGAASASRCDALLERIEKNDAALSDLILLPMKKMDSDADWNRLIHAISRHGTKRCLTSIQASGHGIENHETWTRLGRAIQATSCHVPWKCLAVGKCDMGDAGVVALCTGLLGSNGGGGDSSSSSNRDGGAALLQLEALDLSFKGMKTGAGLLSIIRLCQDCTFLKRLNLSRNTGICGQDGGGEGGSVMENFLEQNDESSCGNNHGIFPHVEDLDLSSCNITGNDVNNDVIGAKLLTRLSLSKNLTILRLSNNPLGSTAATVTALGLILQRLPLKEVYLSNCQISDEAMQALPWTTTDEQTPCCSLLQVLDLSMNQIGATVGGGGGGGIQALTKGLASSMKSLVDLNLAGNPLLFEGVQCLVCSGLLKRKEQLSASSLLSLDLSETKCTGQGAAMAIAQSGAKSLRLYNNDLQSNQGFETIAPCLVGGHATMECLDLSGNGATEASVVHLLRGLLLEQDVVNNYSSKLHTLIVGGNSGGDSVEEIVGQILKIHPSLDIARDKRGSRMQS